MTPRVSGSLLVLLLFAVLATPSLAAPASPPDAVAAAQTTETPEPVAENTTFFLQIESDGDARWTITDTYELNDENETEAFESLAEEFSEGQADAGWLPAFRRANEAASRATGREMEITDVNRSYVVDDRQGTLILEFTWTDFAVTRDSEIVVSDAFNTTDGTWFGSLTRDQRLVISPPAEYGVESAPSAVTDRQLRFEGPRTFEPGYLRVVYTGDRSDTVTSTATDEPISTGNAPLWLGGFVVVALVLVGVVYLIRQGDTDFYSPGASASANTSGNGGGSATTSTTRGDESNDDEVDVELLSDEERVERLLDENGGRMKQARIVTETGWSNAKVSQLLSAMEEEERINKLRIGRENLISFPDEDITDFDE